MKCVGFTHATSFVDEPIKICDNHSKYMEDTKRKSMQTILAAILLIGAVFYAGFSIGQRQKPSFATIDTVVGKDMPSELSNGQTDFSPFWDAWSLLNQKFVASATSTTEQEKVWGAISGLAASLKDPYTVFFPPEESKLFESEIAGNFEGVGMEIGIKDDVLTVVAPLKGTPAERAGILPGDKILKINGLDVRH